jgi:hypothetical protein
MLAVELRSLRDTFVLLFVIGAVLTLGVIVAVWAHLGPGVGTLLTFAIRARVAMAFIALTSIEQW